LWGANLRGADLQDADLRDANLRDAKNIFSQGPLGSRGDVLYSVKHERKIMYKTGCFWGTGEELLKAANNTHGIGSVYAIQYRSAIAMAKVVLKGR
jgi:hypothetical protein